MMRASFCTIVLLLFCGLLFAQEKKEGKSDADERKERKRIVSQLKERINIGESIESMGEWDAKQIKRFGIIDILVDIMEDESSLKIDRLAILDFFQELAFEIEAYDHKDLGQTLLELIEDVTSPNQSVLMLEILFRLDKINHNSTEKKITDLSNKIIADASLPLEKQKYAAMHFVAFNSITEERVNAKTVRTITTLLKKSEKMSPIFQASLLKVIGVLTKAKKGTKSLLKKDEKVQFIKHLVKAIEDNPASSLAVVDGDPAQLELLKASMMSLSLLLADTEVRPRERSDGIELLLKLLKHDEAAVEEISGQALIRIERSLEGEDLKLRLGETFLQNAKGRTVKFDNGGSKEALIGAYRLLLRYMNILVLKDDKIAKEDFGEILSLLRHNFFEIKDKNKGFIVDLSRDGFMSVEMGHIKSGRLGEKAKNQCKGFFSECMKLIAIDSSKNPALRKFQMKAVMVIFEMTGRNYGLDVKLWKKWIDGKEGRKFF